MLRNPELLVAVHAHPLVVVTFTDALPPAAPALALVDERVNTHAAAWLTVNVWPAIVSVPERVDGAALAATL